jgi:hypothetical protein
MFFVSLCFHKEVNSLPSPLKTLNSHRLLFLHCWGKKAEWSSCKNRTNVQKHDATVVFNYRFNHKGSCYLPWRVKVLFHRSVVQMCVCVSPATNAGMIAGATVGSVLVFIFIILFLIYLLRRKRDYEEDRANDIKLDSLSQYCCVACVHVPKCMSVSLSPLLRHSLSLSLLSFSPLHPQGGRSGAQAHLVGQEHRLRIGRGLQERHTLLHHHHC